MKRQELLSVIVILFVLVAAEAAAAQESPRVWAPVIGAPQYFAVLVADADKSARWYRTAFGLRELDRSTADDGSWQIVNLTSDHLFVEVIRDNRATQADRPRGLFKVGFHVPDVEVVADAVGRDTGERPRVLDFARHGVRVVQIRDPDGNMIQLFSRLKE
ncbi:MAG TPA: VOC family protein [Vicinamibacterales bacterium]|nr:VOC family protein [Vicinamibacterales bacterium]